jgi:hypothetical protein
MPNVRLVTLFAGSVRNTGKAACVGHEPRRAPGRDSAGFTSWHPPTRTDRWPANRATPEGAAASRCQKTTSSI